MGLRDRSGILKSEKIGGGAGDLASQSFYFSDSFCIRSGEAMAQGISTGSFPAGARAWTGAAPCIATIGGNLSIGGHGLCRHPGLLRSIFQRKSLTVDDTVDPGAKLLSDEPATQIGEQTQCPAQPRFLRGHQSIELFEIWGCNSHSRCFNRRLIEPEPFEYSQDLVFVAFVTEPLFR
ncbi:MAG: hypothetical protein WAV38_29530 [Xanthobacteraceae bacterium]